MTGLYVWLAALLIGGGGIAGILASWAKAAKKAGQKEAEDAYVQTQITNAKAAGLVIAEHRTARDASDSLRNGQF